MSATALPSRSLICCERTLGTTIRSRTTGKSSSTPLLWRTRSVTVVPAGPRIRCTANSSGQPSVDSPSTPRITSPPRTPARSAGEPSKTVTIVISPSKSCTVQPIPSNEPPMSSDVSR